MRALIVYESLFGNTEAVARAVAAGLSDEYEVTVTEVAEMPSAAGVDLLVVGAPTHAFGLSRPATRQDAVKQGATRPARTGLREYLDTADGITSRTVFAAFDTRVGKPFSGSAARKAGRRLRKLGARPVCPPESFLVTGTSGPLVDGEQKRAESWAAHLATALKPSDLR